MNCYGVGVVTDQKKNIPKAKKKEGGGCPKRTLGMMRWKELSA
jgi:hypothetical protein